LVSVISHPLNDEPVELPYASNTVDVTGEVVIG